ncbi:MAG TPA: hypothetical protein VJ836_04775 [Candidatus Saccharimonadales bacterium]|nr:hypothetical protein [Candidatus Saccharimonadales bacterium]
MSEPRPNLNALRADVGHELANAANHAYDRIVSGDDAAREDFYSALHFAGALIGKPTLGNEELFVRPAETQIPKEAEAGPVLPSLSLKSPGEREAYDALADVDEHYRYRALRAYEQVTDAICHRTPSSGERLPHLLAPDVAGYFIEQIQVLAPVYEAMKARGWEPEVIFVPHGLSEHEWDGLLTGHAAPDDKVSVKPTTHWTDPGKTPILLPPLLPGLSTPRPKWSAGIICGNQRAPLCGISKDGQGPGIIKMMEQLAGLPGMARDMSPVAVIRNFSPDLDDYRALQWQRLARSETPVDTESGAYTILKHNIIQSHPHQSLIATWDERRSRIDFGAPFLDEALVSGGLRPTILAHQLMDLRT